MGWKVAEERRFYDNVRKADGMEPLKAMKLLTKACMDYVGVSKSYSTMVYYAGREWLKVFNKTDHPLAEHTGGMASVSYTHSDAADEEDSVDLGGRRIIQKKKTKQTID